jgi:hypothetical protein
MNNRMPRMARSIRAISFSLGLCWFLMTGDVIIALVLWIPAMIAQLWNPDAFG